MREEGRQPSMAADTERTHREAKIVAAFISLPPTISLSNSVHRFAKGSTRLGVADCVGSSVHGGALSVGLDETCPLLTEPPAQWTDDGQFSGRRQNSSRSNK
ncbi:hypothetical protein TcWFU_003911 [Taenia crassiceps]|uniref:Uncharacterized protein n=1 Tax=Taenia crassiceps TaxID=6207 RepID=A0ABR4Q1H0_9CEST